MNDIDLTSADYEEGLELLRSIKPNSSVLLTFRSGLDSELFNEKKSTKKNSYLSPIQKFRKKFLNCASSKNNNLYDENTALKKNDSIDDYSMLNYQTLQAEEKMTKTEVYETLNATNELMPNEQTPLINLTQQRSAKLISLSNIKDPDLVDNSLAHDHVNIIDKTVETCNNDSNLLKPINNDPIDKIQIIQNGDEICINIGGNIEILTNRHNDRKIISLSPKMNRKVLYDNQINEIQQENSSQGN